MRHAHCDRCNAELADMENEVHNVAIATTAERREFLRWPHHLGLEFEKFKRAELCAACAKTVAEVAKGGGAADLRFKGECSTTTSTAEMHAAPVQSAPARSQRVILAARCDDCGHCEVVRECDLPVSAGGAKTLGFASSHQLYLLGDHMLAASLCDGCYSKRLAQKTAADRAASEKAEAERLAKCPGIRAALRDALATNGRSADSTANEAHR